MANRKTHPESVITPELGRALTEISKEIQRQVGLLIDRRGHIRVVMVGDARSVFIPDLSTYRRGHYRLCGLRLVHTHLKAEGLTEDDLTDLALLRLDRIAAIEVTEDGLPGWMHQAHLLPNNEAGTPWEILEPTTVHAAPADFQAAIDALDREFARNRTPRKAGDQRDRAILAHVGEEASSFAEDSLAELRELSRSAGIHVIDSLHQRRGVHPRYVMGKGRLQQTVIRAMQLGAECLVFDLNLSPAQVQALAEFTDLKILDRTQVILDIFAQHAETREGKIQVELAQLRYMLPRLTAKQAASAFSRLTGGIGGRGPGETKLEIDRRRAQDRIAQLEREITKLGERRRLRRGKRTRRNVPIVSIVGYTNAGKSTLLNALTNSHVDARNALFATLNPVSRRLRFPEEREVVVTDTVGFIRNLPKELKEAFRTTLEELYEADLLLHVLDASAPDVEERFETVQRTLRELNVDDKPIIVALNKADRADAELLKGLSDQYHGIPVSALSPETFPELCDALERALWPLESAVASSNNATWRGIG